MICYVPKEARGMLIIIGAQKHVAMCVRGRGWGHKSIWGDPCPIRRPVPGYLRATGVPDNMLQEGNRRSTVLINHTTKSTLIHL